MRRQDVNPAVKGPLMLLVLGLALLLFAPTLAGQAVGCALLVFGVAGMVNADTRPQVTDE